MASRKYILMCCAAVAAVSFLAILWGVIGSPFSGGGATRLIEVAPSRESRIAIATTTSPAKRAASWNVTGTLVRVADNAIVLKVAQRGRTETEQVIQIDDDTRFTVDQVSGTLADLEPGMRIVAVQQKASATRPERLTVTAFSEPLRGRVTKVDRTGVLLSVQTAEGTPAEITVLTDERTQVVQYTKSANGPYQVSAIPLKDLAIDTIVEVLPKTGTARRISIPLMRDQAADPAN